MLDVFYAEFYVNVPNFRRHLLQFGYDYLSPASLAIYMPQVLTGQFFCLQILNYKWKTDLV